MTSNTAPKFATAAKPDPRRRTSPDSAWPLRRADGTPFYQKPQKPTK